MESADEMNKSKLQKDLFMTVSDGERGGKVQLYKGR